MKRISTIIMALVLALGLTQCKKEQPVSNDIDQGETYTITLNVSGKASGEAKGEKAVVNPSTGSVDYETGDQIHVASNGKYVGTLTYNGTIFTGTIANAVEGEPLQFYFLGNVTPAEELTSGVTESCSVVITDQTQHLPVISGAPSTENFSGEVSNYTAHLLNKCALVKFNVTTASEAATCVTGFNNKVTIDFGENTFTNSQEGNGVITLPAGNGEKWAILLPQAAMTGGEAYAAGDEYAGTFGAVPAIYTNGMFTLGVPVEVTTSTHNYLIDLSTLTGDYEAVDGDTLTGTLTSAYKITIAENAIVTLWNVNINPNGLFNYQMEGGVTSHYDATIVLEGTNTIKYWNEQRPSIYISQNKTLTITGTGSLTASAINGAAIGAGWSYPCGNIVINGGDITATTLATGAGIGGSHSSYGTCGNITINGGNITATSGSGAAGIGCGQDGTCGNITINGGNITAQGITGIGASHRPCGDITITGGTINATGISGAGIGTRFYEYSQCGNITITDGVENVTAKKGGNAVRCIGAAGDDSTCGVVTIGGVVYGEQTSSTTNGVTPNQADGVTFVYPAPETTITWNSSFINSVNIMPWGHDSGVSTSNGGITATFTENAGLSSSGITIGNSSAYGITFSTTTGNISKIEIYGTDNSANGLPSGWSYDETETKVTWQGTSAPSVTMNGVNAGPGEDVHIDYISQIVFTVQ